MELYLHTIKVGNTIQQILSDFVCVHCLAIPFTGNGIQIALKTGFVEGFERPLKAVQFQRLSAQLLPENADSWS